MQACLNPELRPAKKSWLLYLAVGKPLHHVRCKHKNSCKVRAYSRRILLEHPFLTAYRFFATASAKATTGYSVVEPVAQVASELFPAAQVAAVVWANDQATAPSGQA